MDLTVIFLTVTLLVVTTVNGFSFDEPLESNRRLNSRRLALEPSSEDFFANDPFFNQDNSNKPLETRQIQPKFVEDPILREIYAEERRLNLAKEDGDENGPDYDMRSEEARELIKFQRRRFNAMANFAKNVGAVVGIVPSPSTTLPPPPPSPSPEGRSMNFDEEPQEEEVVTSQNVKPVMGRMGISGVFGKVGGAFTSVKQRLFGGGATTTTTTTTPPPPPPVMFPEDLPTEKEEIAQPIVFEELNCTGVQTDYNGKCYNVLQQLPCGPGQWLIEDEVTGKGKCVENKCAHDRNSAYFGGKCVIVRAEGEHCHKGMVTYIFKNGEVECDCKDQHLFNTRDGNCYPAYRQGPCNHGEIFATRITPKGALPASCMRSKCSKDGYFCNAAACPNDRNCVAFKSKCATGVWDIDPVKLTPTCATLSTWKPDKIIGNVPTLACAPGSRRDILGTCRKSSRISFS